MTEEELENEALDLAGEAWQMVLKGMAKDPPKTFEEMVEIARKWVLEDEEKASQIEAKP